MTPGFSISLSGISKFYPGVVALSDVRLEIAAGEVVGLIGENGAGKSTLMKVLGGTISPDRGTIEVAGEKRDSLTPSEHCFQTLGGSAFTCSTLRVREFGQFSSLTLQ